MNHHNHTTAMPLLPERQGKKMVKPLERETKKRRSLYITGIIKSQSRESFGEMCCMTNETDKAQLMLHPLSMPREC